MEWHPFGPNTLVSQDGQWRINKRVYGAQSAYALLKLDADRIFRFVKNGSTADELKQIVEEADARPQ